MSFSQLVSELGPPPEKVKSKKKKKRLSDFGPPLLRIPGHAPGLILKDNFIRSFEKRQIMIINEATDFTPPPPPLDPTVLERPDLTAAQTVYENNNLI